MNKCLVVLLTLLTLVGCQQKVVYLDENGNEINPPKQEEVDYVSSSGERFEIIERISSYLKEVRDSQTGVHYYYLSSNHGKSLTPVYESDGSVRVSE